MTRVVLFILLGVVAAAAAVLSFSALEALALVCGFSPRLAWLLPVVVDAGAAAGSVSWLSSPPGMARQFGRKLALVLLASSVLGNAVGHVLQAYNLQPYWVLVVAVSGLAPAVLAAVVHLTVVVMQDRTDRPEQAVAARAEESGLVHTPEGVGSAAALPTPERFPEAGTVEIFGDPRNSQVGQLPAGDNLDLGLTDGPTVGQEPTVDRAAELIAEGAGRRRLSKELGISEYEARQLMTGRVNGNGLRHERGPVQDWATRGG